MSQEGPVRQVLWRCNYVRWRDYTSDLAWSRFSVESAEFRGCWKWSSSCPRMTAAFATLPEEKWVRKWMNYIPGKVTTTTCIYQMCMRRQTARDHSAMHSMSVRPLISNNASRSMTDGYYNLQRFSMERASILKQNHCVLYNTSPSSVEGYYKKEN